MKVILYWFRNDLRIADNLAFIKANSMADCVLPVYIHQASDVKTAYGFERVGVHRQHFLRQSLDNLQAQLQALDSDLWEYEGEQVNVLLQLVNATGAEAVYCEQIEAPEEIEQCGRIRQQGIALEEFWQSSMIDPGALPFDIQKMPDVFTQFRQAVEREKWRFAQPIGAPTSLAPMPVILQGQHFPQRVSGIGKTTSLYCCGGEDAAQAHLKQYLERRLPDTYKQTRNQLIGRDYSSKFSPWLALGCISARDIAAQLAEYEERHGANEGTYWLWFELLWRDYFRFIHFKY
ncbi:MAG: deoxyribodipyrimidine photolyase, partial [Polynucleobacter sp. 35-46-207]